MIAKQPIIRKQFPFSGASFLSGVLWNIELLQSSSFQPLNFYTSYTHTLYSSVFFSNFMPDLSPLTQLLVSPVDFISVASHFLK